MKQRLAVIEERLLERAGGQTELVTQAAQHIINAGGKRFRPVLVLLASHFGGSVEEEDLIRAALVVELTHVASLYHDDVMDDADLRRGAPSANRQWQNSVAILVGDFLFARASTTVAELGVDYVMLQAETFARLVQGQIAETIGPADDADALAHYLQVVADKTGSLIATSAVFGGMVSGAPGGVLEALRAYGEEIGIVFQLSDDIIDITSDVTGKTPGTDLREGVPTLPTLLALRSEDPADARLQELIRSDLSDDAALAETITLLRGHRAIDEAKAFVAERAENARRMLDPLPDGPAKDALAELCDQVVTRAV
ncbi:polyprenyl synthetase family protein [Granulicoccus sp. GXG6511]|uniref:polyprenyl synthetase family protein n=1 Tax=Granulicoccus sp. GXG6511 TaxID=3381351 RepID=UPI003D7C4E5F